MRDLPSEWLTAHRHLLPPSGLALDVACGRGRHALWLGQQGFSVLALDRDAVAVAAVAGAARRLGIDVRAEVRDLESDDPGLGAGRYDVIVAVSYLHRPLFPFLRDALRPGGALVYETFTREQARRGKPTNPAYLLEPGELRRLVAPLGVLAYREGEYGGRCVASVVARREGADPGGPEGPPLRVFGRAWTAASRVYRDGTRVRQRLPDLGRADAEVRSRPDRAAVAHEDGLRRVVPHAEARGNRVRRATMGLDRHDRVAGVRDLFFQVEHQLFERLGAHAARVAVFEDKHGPLVGLLEQRVDVTLVSDGGEMPVHV
jgi:SAM-dependent methyltransferase